MPPMICFNIEGYLNVAIVFLLVEDKNIILKLLLLYFFVLVLSQKN